MSTLDEPRESAVTPRRSGQHFVMPDRSMAVPRCVVCNDADVVRSRTVRFTFDGQLRNFLTAHCRVFFCAKHTPKMTNVFGVIFGTWFVMSIVLMGLMVLTARFNWSIVWFSPVFMVLLVIQTVAMAWTLWKLGRPGGLKIAKMRGGALFVEGGGEPFLDSLEVITTESFMAIDGADGDSR